MAPPHIHCLETDNIAFLLGQGQQINPERIKEPSKTAELTKKQKCKGRVEVKVKNLVMAQEQKTHDHSFALTS